MSRLMVLSAVVFWGLVQVGTASWLSKHHLSGGALACLIIGAGYFWFAWIIYHDPRIR